MLTFINIQQLNMLQKQEKIIKIRTGNRQYNFYILKALFFIIFLTAMLNSCTTSQKAGAYKNLHNIAGTASSLITSNDSIDRGPTYQIFFKLKETIPCIELSISSRELSDSIAPSYYALKTYFILDRLIDISAFNIKNEQYEYTQLGKNFNSTWEYKREITVCTKGDYPLHKIDNNSLYRLRFTTFTRGQFEYTITIKSNTEIIEIRKP